MSTGGYMAEQLQFSFDIAVVTAYLHALQKVTDQQVAIAEHATELREVYANTGVPVRAVESAWAVAKRRKKAGVTDAEWAALLELATVLIEKDRHGTD